MPNRITQLAHARIAALVANISIAYIHAHNAVHGCFAAKVERHEGDAA